MSHRFLVVLFRFSTCCSWVNAGYYIEKEMWFFALLHFVIGWIAFWFEALEVKRDARLEEGK